VIEGEPIKLSAVGSNFNPKHTLAYVWVTDGGKLQASGMADTTIDTTGVAAGSYTATATATDPRRKKDNSATCAARFTVRGGPMNPPEASCSVSPSVAQSGTRVTITSNVSSPDGSRIVNVSYKASLGHVSGTGNTVTEDTSGIAPGVVTITVSATDARNLTGTASCSFMVEAPPPQVTQFASVAFPDRKRPWHVDSAAETILNEVATRLKADPNAKVAIVGYAEGEKTPMEGSASHSSAKDLAAQRAVNAKAYLVQQQGIDPGRIDVRKGVGKSQRADIDWIPQGADVAAAPLLRGATKVNETVVRPTEGR
jgi:outer membrane protein OmpA-like peptidoglycan-associated protein